MLIGDRTGGQGAQGQEVVQDPLLGSHAFVGEFQVAFKYSRHSKGVQGELDMEQAGSKPLAFCSNTVELRKTPFPMQNVQDFAFPWNSMLLAMFQAPCLFDNSVHNFG